MSDPVADSAVSADCSQDVAAGPVWAWVRAHGAGIALAILLLATGIGYSINLAASGWANAFYSAAVQAGSQSWKAFFFGSSDAGNSITVDKPPLSLWPMAISVRLLGLNSFAILFPQVLMGVGSVWLLHATVKRHFGVVAGLVAGSILALTPVAALMFRFNNPDALLVLLMLVAAWATLRGIESGRIHWVIIAGVAVGLGFLTKQLQVMLIVPALGFAYLVCATPKLSVRIGHLAAAVGGIVAGAGWWIAAVALTPASSRPYIGGSTDNSFSELALGYNGLERLEGQTTGIPVGMGGANMGDMPEAMEGMGGFGGRGGGMWGDSGLFRLFHSDLGGQIAWLLPTSLLLGAVGIVLCGRGSRTDPRWAGMILMAAWLLTTAVVFSFMKGTFHQYYTVALAVPLAGLLAMGGAMMWRERSRAAVRVLGAAAIAVTGAMSVELLGRTPDFAGWLRLTVLVATVLVVAGIVLTAVPSTAFPGRLSVGKVRADVLAPVLLLGALLVGLAGPAAYTVNTIATAHTGSIPLAGPSVSGGMGMPGGMRGNPGDMSMPWQRAGAPGSGDQGSGMTPPGMNGEGGSPSSAGGLLQAAEPSAAITALLEADADSFTWVAATVGSQTAAGYQLATQEPVMPMGGFNGSDPSPTLEQFQKYVADGKVHYFISGGGMGRGGDTSTGTGAITAWVEANFTAKTVDGVTLYDLTVN